MAYIFNSVNVSIFDVHITINPLLFRESKAVQPLFLFLVEANNYRTQYRRGGTITTTSFDVSPLSWREREYNYFWNKYQEIYWLDNKPDFWRLQVPFIVTPKIKLSSNEAALGLSRKGIQATIKPEIFLSGIGWSTNISIQLEGSITPQDLVDLVNIFRNGTNGIQPFLVQGNTNAQTSPATPKTLAKLYEYLANKLVDEVYQKQENSAAAIRAISRYHVISIKKYQGTPLLYKRLPHDKPGIGEMTLSEQRVMHSLLYGRPVSDEETLEQINNRKVLFTQFQDANFALTNFDAGTLNFMQEFGNIPSRSKNTPDCMGNNIRTFLRMVLMLSNFYKNAKNYHQLNPINPKVEALYKTDIPFILREVHQRYGNKCCKGFYSNNNRLKGFSFNN